MLIFDGIPVSNGFITLIDEETAMKVSLIGYINDKAFVEFVYI